MAIGLKMSLKVEWFNDHPGRSCYECKELKLPVDSIPNYHLSRKFSICSFWTKITFNIGSISVFRLSLCLVTKTWYLPGQECRLNWDNCKKDIGCMNMMLDMALALFKLSVFR